MLWDRKLNLKVNINHLRSKGHRALAQLKSVARLEWGGDQSTLMKIYLTTIRPIMEYGDVIYCSASKEDLKLRFSDL